MLASTLGRWREARPSPALWLALGCLLVNVYFYSGFYMSDDVGYLTGIQGLVGPRGIDVHQLAQTRFAVTAPAAVVYAVTGSVTATIASFCLYHPALVLVTFGLGRAIFERGAALVAAALVAFTPIYYFYGGAILPDNCLSLWLGVLCAWVLAMLDWAGREPRAMGAVARRWAVAGLLTGMAYSAKETGVVMTVPVAAVILVAHARRREAGKALLGVFAYGAGLLAFITLETLLLRAFGGQWALRLFAGVGSPETMAALEERVARQGISPLPRLRFWLDRVGSHFGPGLWLVLGANAVAPLCFWRSRARAPVCVLLAFWLWPFLYLTFGTTSFTRYLPPPIQHARYYTVCTMPALLVTAAVLVHLSRRLAQRIAQRRGWLAHAVSAGPGLVAVSWAAVAFAAFEPRAGTAYRAPQTKAALAAFRDARTLYPERPVVLSRRLSRRLAPLLAAPGCSGCGAVAPEVTDPSRVPPRPFLAMLAHSRNPDTFAPSLEALRASGAVRFEPAGHGTYLAPRGRRAELWSALYPLLGELAEPTVRRVDPLNAVELFLVTDAPTARVSPDRNASP